MSWKLLKISEKPHKNTWPVILNLREYKNKIMLNFMFDYFITVKFRPYFVNIFFDVFKHQQFSVFLLVDNFKHGSTPLNIRGYYIVTKSTNIIKHQFF